MVLLVITLAVSWGVLAQQENSTHWQDGMYWVYHAEVYREVSKKQVLWDVSEVTFLAIKGMKLLDTEIWVVAVISHTTLLSLVIYTQECFRPYMRWPLPVEFISTGAKPGPERGFFLELARKGLFGQGPTSFRLVSTGVEIEIAEEGKSAVSTYWTSYEAIAVRYSAKTGQQQREGVAWWADQVGWWVKAEGYEFDETSISLRYSLVLKKYGVLGSEELNAKLAEAFRNTVRQYPEIAEIIRKIFESLQITVPNT